VTTKTKSKSKARQARKAHTERRERKPRTRVQIVSRRALRLPAVLEKSGLKKSALWAKIAEGKFPAPSYPLGDKLPLWDERVIDTWFDRAFAKHDQAVAS
jgi:prophage regulatory protein